MRFIAAAILPCVILIAAMFRTAHAQTILNEEVLPLGIDVTTSAAVKNLVLRRDAATFTFNEGAFYFCIMPDKHTVGAVFIGNGTVALSPPTDIERKNLARFTGKEAFQDEFNRMLVLFSDSTEAELKQKLSFKASRNIKVPPEFQDMIREAGMYFYDANIAKIILDGEQSAMFYAQFNRTGHDPFFIVIDPDDDEEISFLRRQQDDTGNQHTKEILSRFHKAADYAATPYPQDEPRDAFEIESYKTDCTITYDSDFRASAELTLKPLKPNQKWIYFYLYYELKVDSAVWQDGEHAAFDKQDRSYTVFVKGDAAFKQGRTCRLKIYYHGDLMTRNSNLNWYYLKDEWRWYPTYGYNKSTFDMTFRTPSALQFVCVGEKISAETKGDLATSRWLCKSPVQFASFNIGAFRAYKILDPRIPETTVWMAEGGHREIGRAMARDGFGSGADMEKQVGADIANSLAFFGQVYGKCPVDKFSVTEISYRHGVAFPGLIHLAWDTFQYTDRDGSDELFRAHEVAHQWWGIAVDAKSYHDQWLVEGFADYSGLWYMQVALKDNAKFFDMLKDWRESIIYNRQSLFGKGQESGPVWLGYRTNSSTTRGDHSLIIYKKGAWVLHMLRNFMINLETMKEDKFIAMMQEFYATYKGNKASTADFQKIVEKHAGMPMDWFFKQWIYETAVPKYQFGYTVFAPNAEGKYQVNCRIAQLNVPADFQMYVPVKIDFGGGKLARLRVLVKGDTKEITLPLLPMKPERITFNDLESVLCEVENLN